MREQRDSQTTPALYIYFMHVLQAARNLTLNPAVVFNEDGVSFL
jgi:hypothetical protein